MNFVMGNEPKRARRKLLLTLFRAVALSHGLIIGSAPLCLAEAELNRQDPSLDAPPSRRPGAARGALISAQPLSTAAALPSAARNFLVLYNSRSPDDSDVVVTGTVSIPAGNPPAGGWPLINWTHGTTGLAPQCTPSSDTVDGPEHRYLSATQAMLDGFVRRGYVVVATDYQGFGSSGTQAYLVGLGEGRSALDIMRAARKIDLAIGTRYVALGHSQGGQADLFTAAIGPDYAPEFRLLGNVAIAPASHISELVQEVVTGSHPSPILPFATYLLQSYAAYYPEIALERILTPRAIEHLRDTWDGCIDDALASGYWAKSVPSRQFVAQPDLGPLLKAAAANEPGQLRIVAPTLLIQGTSDRTVPPKNTDAVARDLCRVGNSVSYRTYSDASHEGVLDVARADIEAWVDARFAGLEATGNCDDPPSAAASR
jgi:pimeloyl-ACP methyl ester carboxylesterase